MNYSTKFKPKASYETPVCITFEKCNLILCTSPQFGDANQAGSSVEIEETLNL